MQFNMLDLIHLQIKLKNDCNFIVNATSLIL